MILPKPHAREEERLRELESYSILDTLPESDFDNLTVIAASICDTPISLISLTDEKRQWFKSHHGIGVVEIAKDLALCAHAINSPDHFFEVEDARTDDRFFDNPLVVGEPNIVFYAGVPLMSENGLPMGTLCVIDEKPRQLSPVQVKSLKALSQQVMNLFTLRRNKVILEKALCDLEETNKSLERFAMIAAHDLKSPVNNIVGLSELITQLYGTQIEVDGQRMIELIKASSISLKKLIDGLLQYSGIEGVMKENKTWIEMKPLIDEISSLFSMSNDVRIVLKSSYQQVLCNRTIIYHVLINLISNAIKYNDKDRAEVEIGIRETGNKYEFYVKDNGPGIAPEFHDQIFELFSVMTAKDKYGRSGSGIGLATVKKFISKSGGTIRLESQIGKGSTFIFTVEK